jgi:hypothetical protein
MLKILKIVFKEPLVNFLFLGAVLYIYYASVTKDENFSLVQDIVITKQQQQQIKSISTNDVTYNALLLRKFYDDVLLQEAYSLELYKRDKKINDMLLKQMKFILQNSAKIKEPTEKELQSYYENNLKDYSKIKTLSFAHIYINNEDKKRAQELYELVTISDINVSDAKYFGDKTEYPNIIKDIKIDKLQNDFGKYFTMKILKLKSSKWHKAIHSKNGLHIVYIYDKKVDFAYDFDEVQDRVYKDYISQNMQDIVNKAYDEIVKKYNLKVKE